MDYLNQARRVIQMEIDELVRLTERLGEPFCRAIDFLKKAVESGHKIVVVGVGKSGNIGHKIAATLNSTGATAVVLNAQNALHGDLGLLRPGDVILAMSQSGETRELVDLLPYLKRLAAPVIGITGDPDSSLAKHADVILSSAVQREACPLNLAPTSSSTVMLVLGDALAMVLLEARGFSSDDFAALHPGGRLGRILLTRVRDVMRPAESVAIIDPSISIRQALALMTAKRAGAAIVVDAGGRDLVGIFTHGDFVRLFQSKTVTGEERVADHMSRNPVSIAAEKLAAEALQLLERHRVDDLVVVDETNRPVGMLDTQDLARLKLI